MRPGKLYIKITLSFLAVLFITLIIIFALFMASPGRHFTTRLEQFTRTKVLIVKQVVEDKMRSATTTDLSENEQLRDFILNFGEILGAKVWLQRPDGTVPLRSFSGEIPPAVGELKKRRSRDYGSFKLYSRRHSDFYAVIPIAFPEGEKGSIHILFGLKGPPSPVRGFALGLVIIGLIVALFIIPISRLIIKPLKELSQSALQIADGDLSHRAHVKSKDEIGELCHSFNHMADKVEKMIRGGRELTANVSHELRTPLARIRIAEELIRGKLEVKSYQDLDRHLDDIREDIDELDHLIGRILDLSKLDIHESPLKPEPFNPKELIQELLDRLKPAMDHKGLTVETDLSFDPPFNGDMDALYSVFSNVLDNAVKFTPESGRVSVEMRSDEDTITVSVTNTFDALPEGDLINIFEPFYRTKEKKAEGSGLGLAITKKIVEKHGGTIEALNWDEGLKIQIRLPADQSERGV